MNREELTYLAVLLGSIPVGFVLQGRGPRWRQFGGAAVGAGLALLTCGAHALHSLGTVLGTWLILTCAPRRSGGAALAWTFGYLLFFRTPWVWGLPEPPALANALQLLVTLKMVSLASDVQELREAELKGVTSEETRLLIGSLQRVPSLIDILCYSYCYLGLLTGPFYRLGTHLDWVRGPAALPSARRALLHARWAPALAALAAVAGAAWPAEAALRPEFSARPWAARLALMVPVFAALRARLYVGWLCAESGCVAAGLGVYPKSARARPGQGPTAAWERPEACAPLPDDQWDFEAIRTVDPWGTELGRRFRGGLRRWNMTVQWWLAAYVHRRGPRRYPLLRNACTMLASAYWHGLHGGQHLAFLSVPLWLAAEAALEAALEARFGVPLERLGGPRGSLLRGAQWFLKMRAFEYLSMGFVLRGAAATLRFWASVHFCLHAAPLLLLLLAAALGKNGREKGEKEEKGREKGEKGREDEEKEPEEDGEGEGEAQLRRRRRRMEDPSMREGEERLNPEIQQGGEPQNWKNQEGGGHQNPKIQEGGESQNWKNQEGWETLNPKAQQGGESQNWKIQQGGETLNPKIQQGGEPQNPKIQQGGEPQNPKIQEVGEPQNWKIQHGGESPNWKIQEGRETLNPKIKEGGDALNPKIQQAGEPQNQKIQEGQDPLNPKSQELRKRMDPDSQSLGGPQTSG